MTSEDEQIRDAIAGQACDWFVNSDAESLDARGSSALIAWLRTSPVHVEELLRVAGIARDLREAPADAEYAVATLVARARAADDSPRYGYLTPIRAGLGALGWQRWQSAAATAAVLGALGLGALLMQPRHPPTAAGPVAAGPGTLHFETRHGEQLTHRLADDSVLHLNTDSVVTVRYSRAERLIEVVSGEAAFEVAHEPARVFRVFAGSAAVTAVGTKFDVRLDSHATWVTVIDGQVAVGRSRVLEDRGTGPGRQYPPQFVQLSADQQLRVANGEWPATPVMVDAQRATAWLHRQIVFRHEPLSRVAAEFNRYAPKPIEITTPALRDLEVSGVFTIGDTTAFLAFLRSLDGVHVEETATRIRV
jgi:ferric-dicitrate binding protein FerR (iron transport regulator)